MQMARLVLLMPGPRPRVRIVYCSFDCNSSVHFTITKVLESAYGGTTPPSTTHFFHGSHTRLNQQVTFQFAADPKVLQHVTFHFD